MYRVARLAGLALAIAVLLAVGRPASAKPAEFTIYNQSSWTISYVYISSTDVSEWGPDQLGDSQTIAPGQSFLLYKIPCDDYDVKIVSSDGVECVINGVRMCRDSSSYTITDETLAACSGMAASSSGGSISDLLARLITEPSNDELLGDLGDAYAASGDAASARRYYLEAFKVDPGDSEWQGRVVEFGGVNDAIGYLSSVVSPTDDERLGDLGDLLRAAGRIGEACGRWQQAYALDPSDSEWGPKLAENCPESGVTGAAPSEEGSTDVTAGQEALARGDREAAKGFFDAALLKDPTDKEALTGMVVASGRPGTEILADLVTRVPNNDELWGNLGDAWVLAGDTAKAREAYLRAAVLDPGDGEWKRALEILGVATAP